MKVGCQKKFYFMKIASEKVGVEKQNENSFSLSIKVVNWGIFYCAEVYN